MALNALVGAGLVSGGASLIGNMLGIKSQSDANKTNLKIAQMNNEFNERMLQKQMDYNTQMWNAENEYNSAANQVQRYKDAGLNAALMMQNGGSAGMASSANGVETPTATPASVSPLDYGSLMRDAANTFNSTMSQLSATENQQAQTQGIRVENQYLEQKLMSEIGNLLADTKNKGAMTTYQQMVNNNYQQYVDSQIGEMQQHVKLMQAQESLNIAQKVSTNLLAELSRKDLQNYDQRFINEMAEIGSRIALNNANQYKSYKDAETSVAQGMLNYALANGQRISNGIAYKSSKLVLQELANNVYNSYWQGQNTKYNAKMSRGQYEWLPYDKWNGHINNYLNSASQVVSSVGSVIAPVTNLSRYLSDKKAAKQLNNFMNPYSSPSSTH